MFKKVTKLLGAIALTGWMGVANATLIFDFSWDSAGGQIIGVIEGLEEIPGIQQATSVTLISANNDALNTDYVGFPSENTVYNNAFSVVNGEISSVYFHGVRTYYKGRFRRDSNLFMCGGCQRDSSQPPVEVSASWYDRGRDDFLWAATAPPRFERRVTVPEPSTVILLSLGLAGLSLVRYRKLS